MQRAGPRIDCIGYEPGETIVRMIRCLKERDLHIHCIRSASSEEWDNIWRDCDYATYFHSREWAEIWNIYTQDEICPDPRKIEFSDGKHALLPLSFRKRINGMMKEYLSSPAGTFGGWVSTDELSVAHAILLASYLHDACDNLVWRFNPYDPLTSKTGIPYSNVDVTHFLELKGGFDVLHKRWHKNRPSILRKVKKAGKSGVQIRPAALNEDWYSYYKIYQKSLVRWGARASSRYSWELFEEMFKKDSPDIILWLATYENKIIAGAICFYSRRHAVYWHGASLSEYFSLRPVNLLFYEIIRDACDRGCSWFDFNPSGGHEGVKAFKLSFGAEPLSSPVVTRQSLPMKVLKKFFGILQRR